MAKMKVMNKILSVGLITTMALFVQIASAAPTEMLPESSYQGGAWQGSRYYNLDSINVKIDFAVYDTLAYPGEFTWAGEVDMPDTDQYIYAYQIFNSPAEGYDDIASFRLLDTDGQEIDESLMHSTCSQKDSDIPVLEGVVPEPTVSTVQGQWVWSIAGGYISQGEHSWFLIFSSEYAPTAGTYEVTAPADIPVPTPEPATALLLSLGCAMLIVRSKKSAKIT
ncbi:MAG: PEP-CTERM sorting domain-containing protein [Sedimentisphaerales bacterium]|nr:PEP-CTERM sorting domain-containing protein [Sedimentisphaerales bacterium]